MGALSLAGMVGYRSIEAISWTDALCMTVITLSTVGFQEVVPLSPAGRLFTVALIIFGVGVAVFVITSLAQSVLEGQLQNFFRRSTMQRNVERSVDHVIVCGYGPLGRAGANHVISPFHLGGTRAAASILRPTVTDFLEISAPRHGEEIDLEEVRIDPGSALSGRSVAELESVGRLRIVALRSSEQAIELVPDRDATVEAGDHLVVIGGREELLCLAQEAQRPQS